MSQTPRQREFVRLLEACQRDLLAYILTLVPNMSEAHEVHQETVAALWVKFDEYDRTRPFGAWARRFAHLQVLRYRTERTRQAGRAMLLTDDALSGLVAEYEQHADVLDTMRDALQGCMDKLRSEDRDLLKMRYWQEIALREVAEQVGNSEPQLKSRLFRIRRSLMTCIERALIGQG